MSTSMAETVAAVVAERNQLRAYAELITAPARELLELYDLRPKLAEMEACDMAAWGKLQSDTKAALRQYGERKKAGWIALRAALGARVTASEILEKNAEASRPETNCYSCPSCAGDATGAMRDDVVEYGDPPVRLPYRCLVVTCAKCGSFTGADGEDARQAAVDAHLDSLHQSGKKSGEFCAGCGKAYDDHHGYPPACYTTTDSPRFEFQVGRERTDADYAIEFGGYLATAAKRLLDAQNAVDALDELDPADRERLENPNYSIDVEEAREARSDARSGLRSAIFEFEKRRDRALQSVACTQPPTVNCYHFGRCVRGDSPEGVDLVRCRECPAI